VNCLIYPYYDKLYSVIDNLEYFNSDIRVSVAVSPRTWRKSIIHTDNLKDICLTDDYDQHLDEVDAVIIADVTDKDFMYNDILNKIIKAVNVHKKTIICTKIKQEDLELIRNKYPDSDLKILYDDMCDFSYNTVKHENQNSVCIGVGPLYRGLDDTITVTYLARGFREKGYNVAVVSPNETCRILGFYPFPSYLLGSGGDIEKKVEQLNAYFSYVEKTSKCDVLIIQFPDGMLKYSDYTEDSYGIIGYMITRAVLFDYFVLVSLYDICRSEHYDKIKKLFLKNYGIPADVVVVQPTRIQFECNPEFREYSFTRYKLELCEPEINELVSKEGQNIFKLDDTGFYRSITEHCINKLS
jgi:peptide maturation system protein (TIGR04066 family)